MQKWYELWFQKTLFVGEHAAVWLLSVKIVSPYRNTLTYVLTYLLTYLLTYWQWKTALSKDGGEHGTSCRFDLLTIRRIGNQQVHREF